MFIAVSLILCGLRLNLQSLNLPSGQSNLMRTFIFLYTITMISFHPLFYKALIIHRFPLKKYQETFMTLLFFLYFFRFGHKIYSKVSTKVSSNQSKQFQSKNWYTFLRRKVKNSLSHKINISSSVVSVDISSPMDNSDSTALLQSFWSQWLVWQLNSSSCPDDKQDIQRQRLNSHNSSI